MRRHEDVPRAVLRISRGLRRLGSCFSDTETFSSVYFASSLFQPSRSEVGASTKAGALSGSGGSPLLAALRRFLAAALSVLLDPVHPNNAAKNATVCSVLPRPMSSARIPPRPGRLAPEPLHALDLVRKQISMNRRWHGDGPAAAVLALALDDQIALPGASKNVIRKASELGSGTGPSDSRVRKITRGSRSWLVTSRPCSTHRPCADFGGAFFFAAVFFFFWAAQGSQPPPMESSESPP